MAELLHLFTTDSPIKSKGSKIGLPLKKQRANKIADFHLKKLDILSRLTYTDGICGKPIIRTTVIESLPGSMIAFSKAVSSKKFNQIVHFYESDRSFARIMHNPQKYAKILSRFEYVISPDFSQHLDMPQFLCMQNSWWNNAFGAYWQSLGINTIPNYYCPLKIFERR